MCDHATGTVVFRYHLPLVVGDTLTIGDGVHSLTWEAIQHNYDHPSTSGAVGLVLDDLMGSDGYWDDVLVGTSIIEDINGFDGQAFGDTPPGTFYLSASTAYDESTMDLTMTLKAYYAGAESNIAITQTANADVGFGPAFNVSGMSGGLAVACDQPTLCSSASECAYSCDTVLTGMCYL